MSVNYGDIFYKGYDRGNKAMSEYVDARNKGLARRVMRELDSMTTRDPNAVQTAAFGRENSAMAALDNETFGTTAKAEDYQYGKPQLVEARGLGDVERFRRAEAIQNDYGFTEQANLYGERSRQAGLQDKADVRDARTEARDVTREARAAETHGLQTREAKRKEDKDKGRSRYDTESNLYQADKTAKNEPINPGELYAIGAKHGVSKDDINREMMNQFGADKAVVEARSSAHLDTLRKASLVGLQAMFDASDTNTKDGKEYRAITNKDGTTSILYGKDVQYTVPKPSAGFSVAGMWLTQVEGRLKGNEVAAGLLLMSIDKAKVDIEAARANARESDAKAWAARNPQAGTGVEKLTALTGYANSLNSEIANIDRSMAANADPTSATYKGYVAQRERALGSLKKVRSQIEGARLGINGAPASGAVVTPARGTVETDDEGNRFEFVGGKGGDNRDDPAQWKRAGEAKPTASPRAAVDNSTPAVTARTQAKQDAQAAATKTARIAQLREIIASPTMESGKGLWNNPRGASLQSTKDKAKLELDKLLAK